MSLVFRLVEILWISFLLFFVSNNRKYKKLNETLVVLERGNYFIKYFCSRLTRRQHGPPATGKLLPLSTLIFLRILSWSEVNESRRDATKRFTYKIH